MSDTPHKPIGPLAPQPTSVEPAAPGAQYQMPAINPGQTNGIIGLCLAFIGLAPIGLVFSVVSTVQSGKVNTPRALGIIGIVFNALAIVVFGFFVLVLIFAALNKSQINIEQRSAAIHAKSMAYEVEIEASEFYSHEGAYPQSIADFGKYETSKLDASVRLVEKTPTDIESVGYMPCGRTGAVVLYFTAASSLPIPLYLGDGSYETCPK